MSANQITAIVSFWLADALEDPEVAYARRDWWYQGGADVDREIGARFEVQVEQACGGRITHWQDSPNGALALILLLDQFTRNLYRHSPQAYVGDARAFEIVNHSIDRGLDRELHAVSRIWLYHPFHHAERLEDQDRGIVLLNDLLAQSPERWHRLIERSIWGWTRHRDIVARFGRFPHRNQVLGRESTDAEREFLRDNGESFGQGPS